MTATPTKAELLDKIARMQEAAGVCPTCGNKRRIPNEDTGYLKPCPDCETRP